MKNANFQTERATAYSVFLFQMNRNSHGLAGETEFLTHSRPWQQLFRQWPVLQVLGKASALATRLLRAEARVTMLRRIQRLTDEQGKPCAQVF
mmetsp:Transcript_155922/g.275496  ORF Transcript_155922/g.275496 Transcript_155922/m.275496 type:complete len:93 (-) Transcript_155922:262-540(-)